MLKMLFECFGCSDGVRRIWNSTPQGFLLVTHNIISRASLYECYYSCFFVFICGFVRIYVCVFYTSMCVCGLCKSVKTHSRLKYNFQNFLDLFFIFIFTKDRDKDFSRIIIINHCIKDPQRMLNCYTARQKIYNFTWRDKSIRIKFIGS